MAKKLTGIPGHTSRLFTEELGHGVLYIYRCECRYHTGYSASEHRVEMVMRAHLKDMMMEHAEIHLKEDK